MDEEPWDSKAMTFFVNQKVKNDPGYWEKFPCDRDYSVMQEARELCKTKVSFTKKVLACHEHRGTWAGENAYQEAANREDEAKELCKTKVKELKWTFEHPPYDRCDCGECEQLRRAHHWIRHYVPKGTVNRAKALLKEEIPK